MGIFSKMKRAAKSKANAAVEKAIDPEKEISMAILELEEQRKAALEELLSFKTSSKKMEQDMARLDEKIAKWEKNAMTAVKAGDDELAKKCLAAKKNAAVEKAKIQRDRDEATSLAVDLNKSRKQFEAKLKMLKLKKGTLAAQIAAARSGSGNLLGVDDRVFDKFQEAQDRIDEETIEAEVQAALDGDEVGSAVELESQLLGTSEEVDAEDALEALKSKMNAEDEPKKLGS
jgi:phage shock protein A